MKAWERNKNVKVFEWWICCYRHQVCCICISPSFLRSFWTLTNSCRVSYPPSILPRVSPRRFSQSLQSLSGDLGRTMGWWAVLLGPFWRMCWMTCFFLVILLWSNHMSQMDHIERVLHLLPVLALHCLVLCLFFEVTYMFQLIIALYTYMFSVVFIDSHDCSPVLNDQWSLFWIGVSEHMKRAALLWWWFNKLSYCKWLSCSWNEF